MRGSAAQWWEVDWTRDDTRTTCPGLLSDRDVLLGRPGQGLTAQRNPDRKTCEGEEGEEGRDVPHVKGRGR